MSKKSGLITVIILAAVLIVAAIKNPSVVESKQLLKDAAIEKINEGLRTNLADENSGTKQQIFSALGLFFAPTLIDKMVDIEVNDYVFFSTFKATIAIEDENKNLASGVILFGKIIPLSSDLKQPE